MQAMILAGGFGTRLQPVISGMPKVMAPVRGKPFLAYLLDYLAEQGITRVTLCVHYLWEQIKDYFQDVYQGISIAYSVETEPLGTGGAIVHALRLFNIIDRIFVLNGDTLVKLNYRLMYQHQFMMAVAHVSEASRYGKVILDQGIVTHFQEKGVSGAGWVNAGVYLLTASLFEGFDLPEKFSFENDFILPNLSLLKPAALMTNHHFIDIGMPADYRSLIDLDSVIV